MDNQKVPKNDKKFFCEFCDYHTSRKSQFYRHLLTLKHKNRVEYNKITTNYNKKSSNICECGKEYNHRASLYNHQKRCSYQAELNPELKVPKLSSDMIVKLIQDNNDIRANLLKENLELRNQLNEQHKQITEMIPRIGNNNNTLKQKFNINVFLNEKCKDALSMDEFIEKIEISMKDLLTTREKGQVQGISNIIIENINKLSLYERPLHCTDKKRETLYIKNQEWEKDDNREYIGKALKKVESKQIKNIKIWLDEHPDYMNIPDQQEEFAKLISECGKSVDEYGEKIVKNLCNNVYVDKEDN
jgi:hypothetical protein